VRASGARCAGQGPNWHSAGPAGINAEDKAELLRSSETNTRAHRSSLFSSVHFRACSHASLSSAGVPVRESRLSPLHSGCSIQAVFVGKVGESIFSGGDPEQSSCTALHCAALHCKGALSHLQRWAQPSTRWLPLHLGPALCPPILPLQTQRNGCFASSSPSCIPASPISIHSLQLLDRRRPDLAFVCAWLSPHRPPIYRIQTLPSDPAPRIFFISDAQLDTVSSALWPAHMQDAAAKAHLSQLHIQSTPISLRQARHQCTNDSCYSARQLANAWRPIFTRINGILLFFATPALPPQETHSVALGEA
jgi:hypothetical protein